MYLLHGKFHPLIPVPNRRTIDSARQTRAKSWRFPELPPPLKMVTRGLGIGYLLSPGEVLGSEKSVCYQVRIDTKASRDRRTQVIRIDRLAARSPRHRTIKWTCWPAHIRLVSVQNQSHHKYCE